MENRQDGAQHRRQHAGRACAWIGTLLAAALFAHGTSAHADPLLVPNASVAASALLNFGPRQDTIAFGTIGATDPRIGTASFTSTAAPLPTLRADAQIGTGADMVPIFGRGAGFLTYYFEILGPTASPVDVLVDVTGAASADTVGGGSFAVRSIWQLFDSLAFTSILASDTIDSGQLSGHFDQAFGRTVDLTLQTNHLYALFLLADAAAAAADATSRAIASAIVDPRLSFAAGVDTGLFSFVLSEGIGNGIAAPPTGGSVPEPGMLALLAIAAIGASRVRRREPRAP